MAIHVQVLDRKRADGTTEHAVTVWSDAYRLGAATAISPGDAIRRAIQSARTELKHQRYRREESTR